jgi:hypothetical protein
LKTAWIALAMMVACGAWGQSQPPAPAPSKQSDPHQQQATHEQQPTTNSQRGTENDPFVIKITDGHHTDEASPNTENESGRKSLIWGMDPDYATAVFTGLLVAIGAATAIVLGFQSWLLRRQVNLAREDFSTTARAFVYLEDIEPTISVFTDNPANKGEEIPQKWKELFITYFAWQPKWKNAGNSPTSNMKIRVAQQFFESGGMPPEFDFAAALPDERNFFLGPHATAGGEVVTTNSHFANMVINDGLGSDALIFVFGRADYEDIFRVPHFVEWCYKVRLWRPANESGLGRLRATFIQYGNYNRTDHDA